MHRAQPAQSGCPVFDSATLTESPLCAHSRGNRRPDHQDACTRGGGRSGQAPVTQRSRGCGRHDALLGVRRAPARLCAVAGGLAARDVQTDECDGGRTRPSTEDHHLSRTVWSARASRRHSPARLPRSHHQAARIQGRLRQACLSHQTHFFPILFTGADPDNHLGPTSFSASASRSQPGGGEVGPSAPGPTLYPRPALRPPAGSRGTGYRCKVTGENREGATMEGKLCVVVNAFESRGGHRRRETPGEVLRGKVTTAAVSDRRWKAR